MEVDQAFLGRSKATAENPPGKPGFKIQGPSVLQWNYLPQGRFPFAKHDAEASCFVFSIILRPLCVSEARQFHQHTLAAHSVFLKETADGEGVGD